MQMKDNFSGTQHKLQDNTGVAMYNTTLVVDSTILVANTISNTDKFAKMVHIQIFLLKMVVRIVIAQTKTIDD